MMTRMRSKWGWAALALVACSAVGAYVVRAYDEGLFVFLSLVAFAALLGVLAAARCDAVCIVVAAYLITPGPANNVLPSALLFPAAESGYGATNLFVLPDLVLVAALVATRRWSVKRSLPVWLGVWTVGLVGIAVCGAVIGLTHAPVDTVLGQAFLWVRVALLVVLVVRHVRRRGTESVAVSVVQAVVAGTSVIALQLIALTVIFGDNATVGDFVVTYDGRARLPGWGNNLVVNAIVVGLALLLLNRRRLPLGGAPLRAALVVVHLAALVVGQTRLSFVLAAALLLVSGVRWVWGRPIARVALPALGIVVLASPWIARWATVLNPRFASLPDAVGAFTGQTDTYAPGGGSFATRGHLWRAAWSMGADSPVIGHGWGSWGFLRQQYSPVLLETADPHNGYLYAFAEGGALGVLVIYLVPVLVLFRRGLPMWLRATLIVALALEIANPNVFKPHYLVLVVPLVVLAAMWQRQSPSTDDEARPPTAQTAGSTALDR
jgi:hypothetical protein